MSTEITEHKVKLKEVLKGSKGELIVLQDFDQTKESLQKVVDKYKDLIITKENFDEGKTARAEVREYRYGLQNISKHNKSLMNQAKNDMVETLDSLINVLTPTEDKIDKQIKEIENEKKIEKERKEKEEAERVSKINRQIADARVEFEKIISFGRNDDDVEKFCKLVDDLAQKNADDEFEEFGFEIQNLIEEYNDRLPELRDRVEQIKKDEQIKLENERNQKILLRQSRLIKAGLVENHVGGFEYGNFVIPEDIVHNASDESFNESLENVTKTIKEDEKQKQILLDEENRKKEQEQKQLQAEKEKFEKEKLEFENNKKEEKFKSRKQRLIDLGFKYFPVEGDNYNFILNDVWSSYEEQVRNQSDEEFNDYVESIKQAVKNYELKKEREAQEKAEAEKQKKIEQEKQLKELVDKSKSLAVSFEGIDLKGDRQIVIDALKSRITSAEQQQSLERKKLLKDKAQVHIDNVEPLIKQVFTYFESCEIEKEHENSIVELEDDLRKSFKKFKKSIS